MKKERGVGVWCRQRKGIQPACTLSNPSSHLTPIVWQRLSSEPNCSLQFFADSVKLLNHRRGRKARFVAHAYSKRSAYI